MGAAQLADAKGLDLDIMIQSVEKKIIERIKELQKLNKDGKIKPSTFTDELKKARRSLGTIVTNNPDILEKDLVKLFGDGDLTPERVTKHFRNYTDRITALYKSLGKEGHHSQGIGTLRDYLVDVGYDVRKQYKNIAKLRGFKIGDQYMKYLDTGAHRSMTRGIEGILKQRGYNIADLPPGLINAIEARMAHAKHFGGQGAKINIPTAIVRSLSATGDAEKLVDLSTPVLALNKASTQSGMMMDAIFSNPELVDDLDALYAAVRKTPIIDTSGIRRGISEIERNIKLYGPNMPEGLLKGTVHDVLQESARITQQLGEGIQKIPGVKPAVQTANFVRKHPVTGAILTLPVFTAFDISEAYQSGSKLLTNKWDSNKKISDLEQKVEKSRFLAASSGVATLSPAAPVMGPTSLISGAVSLVLENRLKRLKEKRHEEDILIGPPKHIKANTPSGVAEIKQRKRNLFELTNDKYLEWLRS